MRIGVDLMGSDSSPEILYQGVLEAIKKLPEDVFFLVFATHLLEPKHPRITFQTVSEVITMEDDPLSSVRLKKDASLVVGMRALKEGTIDGFVSAGNTGALITLASLTLPLLPGIERPALLALLPTKKRPFAMIDAGGSLTYKSKNLVQYAQMGAAFQKSLFNIEKPTIGLLNIGVESKKGTREVREAYNALKEVDGFVGNVEAREVFEGNIDVLVTDGFTGNILLKASEGVSNLIFEYLLATAPELKEQIQPLQAHFSYDAYPGAILSGTKAHLMKCHGKASKEAMMNSILGLELLISKAC